MADYRIDPQGIKPSKTDNDILTTVAGVAKWAPPGGAGTSGIVLIDYGTSPAAYSPAARSVIFRTAGTPAQIAVDLGAAAAYELDEASGNFADSSGNSRTATAGAGVTYAQAPIGSTSGSSVKGSGTAMIAEYAAAHGIAAGAATLAAWVRVPSSATAIGGPIAKLGTVGNGFDFGFNANGASWASGRFIGIGQNGVNYRNPGYAITNAAQDLHIAITYDSATISVFVNGDLVRTVTATAMVAPGNSLRIGYGETGEFLTSSVLVDHVCFFPTVLTPAKVKQLVRTGATAIGWWDGSALQPLG